MDHETALRTQALERYVLEEMSPAERDRFEEHYFSCQECAETVQRSAALVAAIRLHLAKAPSPAPAVTPQEPPLRRWFDRLRNLAAHPALAVLMLAIIGFQNLVQVPALRRALHEAYSPRALTSYVLQGETRAASTTIAMEPGRDLLIETNVDSIGPDAAFEVLILGAEGQPVITLPGPIVPRDYLLQIFIPRGRLAPGSYTLVVNTYGGPEHKRIHFEVGPASRESRIGSQTRFRPLLNSKQP
jgi:hypothetical protein